MELIEKPCILKNEIKIIDKSKYQIASYMGSVKFRACILASKSCEIFHLTEYCTEDLAVISLKLSMNNALKQVIVASSYTPPEGDFLPPDYWIIGTDANSHHVVWGSSDNNVKGEALLQFIFIVQI